MLLFVGLPDDIEAKILFFASCLDLSKLSNDLLNLHYLHSNLEFWGSTFLSGMVEWIGNHFMQLGALKMSTPNPFFTLGWNRDRYCFDRFCVLQIGGAGLFGNQRSRWIDCLDLFTNDDLLQNASNNLTVEWCAWHETPYWRVIFGTQEYSPSWKF